MRATAPSPVIVEQRSSPSLPRCCQGWIVEQARARPSRVGVRAAAIASEERRVSSRSTAAGGERREHDCGAAAGAGQGIGRGTHVV